MNESLQKYRTRVRVKLCSFLLAVVFFMGTILESAPVRAQSAVSIEGMISQFHIPSEIGTIQSRYAGKYPASPVILIQDAHANYSAQKHIHALMMYIAKTYGVKKICLEGSAGPLDVSLYKGFPLGEEKASIIHDEVRAGRVTGPEEFAITTTDDVPVVGVEDETLYLAQLKTYADLFSVQTEAYEWVQQKEELLEDEIKRKLPSDLQELFIRQKAFQKDHAQFLAYDRFLLGLAQKQHMSLFSYPSVRKVLSLARFEKNIEVARLSAETKRLVNDIVEKTLTTDEMITRLAQAELDIREKRIEPYAYYAVLKDAALRSGIDWKGYIHVCRYYYYVQLLADISPTRLMKERVRLEREIIKNYTRTPEERTTIMVRDGLKALENIVRLKALPSEWRFYKINKKELIQWCEARGEKLPHISTFETYYEQALAREKSIVEQTVAYAQEPSRRKDRAIAPTILVAGGYHTAGIAAQLQKRKLSYAIVTPRVADTDKGALLYEKIMAASMRYFGVTEGTHGGTLQIMSSIADYHGMDADTQETLRRTVLPRFVKALSKHPRKKELINEWNRCIGPESVVDAKTNDQLFFIRHNDIRKALEEGDIEHLMKLAEKGLLGTHISPDGVIEKTEPEVALSETVNYIRTHARNTEIPLSEETIQNICETIHKRNIRFIRHDSNQSIYSKYASAGSIAVLRQASSHSRVAIGRYDESKHAAIPGHANEYYLEISEQGVVTELYFLASGDHRVLSVVTSLQKPYTLLTSFDATVRYEDIKDLLSRYQRIRLTNRTAKKRGELTICSDRVKVRMGNEYETKRADLVLAAGEGEKKGEPILVAVQFHGEEQKDFARICRVKDDGSEYLVGSFYRELAAEDLALLDNHMIYNTSISTSGLWLGSTMWGRSQYFPAGFVDVLVTYGKPYTITAYRTKKGKQIYTRLGEPLRIALNDALVSVGQQMEDALPLSERAAESFPAHIPPPVVGTQTDDHAVHTRSVMREQGEPSEIITSNKADESERDCVVQQKSIPRDEFMERILRAVHAHSGIIPSAAWIARHMGTEQYIVSRFLRRMFNGKSNFDHIVDRLGGWPSYLAFLRSNHAIGLDSVSEEVFYTLIMQVIHDRGGIIPSSRQLALEIGSTKKTVSRFLEKTKNGITNRERIINELGGWPVYLKNLQNKNAVDLTTVREEVFYTLILNAAVIHGRILQQPSVIAREIGSRTRIVSDYLAQKRNGKTIKEILIQELANEKAQYLENLRKKNRISIGSVSGEVFYTLVLQEIHNNKGIIPSAPVLAKKMGTTLATITLYLRSVRPRLIRELGGEAAYIKNLQRHNKISLLQISDEQMFTLVLNAVKENQGIIPRNYMLAMRVGAECHVINCWMKKRNQESGVTNRERIIQALGGMEKYIAEVQKHNAISALSVGEDTLFALIMATINRHEGVIPNSTVIAHEVGARPIVIEHYMRRHRVKFIEKVGGLEDYVARTSKQSGYYHGEGIPDYVFMELIEQSEGKMPSVATCAEVLGITRTAVEAYMQLHSERLLKQYRMAQIDPEKVVRAIKLLRSNTSEGYIRIPESDVLADYCGYDREDFRAYWESPAHKDENGVHEIFQILFDDPFISTKMRYYLTWIQDPFDAVVQYMGRYHEYTANDIAVDMSAYFGVPLDEVEILFGPYEYQGKQYRNGVIDYIVENASYGKQVFNLHSVPLGFSTLRPRKSRGDASLFVVSPDTIGEQAFIAYAVNSAMGYFAKHKKVPPSNSLAQEMKVNYQKLTEYISVIYDILSDKGEDERIIYGALWYDDEVEAVSAYIEDYKNSNNKQLPSIDRIANVFGLTIKQMENRLAQSDMKHLVKEVKRDTGKKRVSQRSIQMLTMLIVTAGIMGLCSQWGITPSDMVALFYQQSDWWMAFKDVIADGRGIYVASIVPTLGKMQRGSQREKEMFARMKAEIEVLYEEYKRLPDQKELAQRVGVSLTTIQKYMAPQNPSRPFWQYVVDTTTNDDVRLHALWHVGQIQAILQYMEREYFAQSEEVNHDLLRPKAIAAYFNVNPQIISKHLRQERQAIEAFLVHRDRQDDFAVKVRWRYIKDYKGAYHAYEKVYGYVVKRAVTFFAASKKQMTQQNRDSATVEEHMLRMLGMSGEELRTYFKQHVYDEADDDNALWAYIVGDRVSQKGSDPLIVRIQRHRNYKQWEPILRWYINRKELLVKYFVALINQHATTTITFPTTHELAKSLHVSLREIEAYLNDKRYYENDIHEVWQNLIERNGICKRVVQWHLDPFMSVVNYLERHQIHAFGPEDMENKISAYYRCSELDVERIVYERQQYQGNEYAHGAIDYIKEQTEKRFIEKGNKRTRHYISLNTVGDYVFQEIMVNACLDYFDRYGVVPDPEKLVEICHAAKDDVLLCYNESFWEEVIRRADNERLIESALWHIDQESAYQSFRRQYVDQYKMVPDAFAVANHFGVALKEVKKLIKKIGKNIGASGNASVICMCLIAGVLALALMVWPSVVQWWAGVDSGQVISWVREGLQYFSASFGGAALIGGIKVISPQYGYMPHEKMNKEDILTYVQQHTSGAIDADYLPEAVDQFMKEGYTFIRENAIDKDDFKRLTKAVVLRKTVQKNGTSYFLTGRRDRNATTSVHRDEYYFEYVDAGMVTRVDFLKNPERYPLRVAYDARSGEMITSFNKVVSYREMKQLLKTHSPIRLTHNRTVGEDGRLSILGGYYQVYFGEEYKDAYAEALFTRSSKRSGEKPILLSVRFEGEAHPHTMTTIYAIKDKGQEELIDSFHDAYSHEKWMSLSNHVVKHLKLAEIGTLHRNYKVWAYLTRWGAGVVDARVKNGEIVALTAIYDKQGKPIRDMKAKLLQLDLNSAVAVREQIAQAIPHDQTKPLVSRTLTRKFLKTELGDHYSAVNVQAARMELDRSGFEVLAARDVRTETFSSFDGIAVLRKTRDDGRAYIGTRDRDAAFTQHKSEYYLECVEHGVVTKLIFLERFEIVDLTVVRDAKTRKPVTSFYEQIFRDDIRSILARSKEIVVSNFRLSPAGTISLCHGEIKLNMGSERALAWADLLIVEGAEEVEGRPILTKAWFHGEVLPIELARVYKVRHDNTEVLVDSYYGALTGAKLASYDNHILRDHRLTPSGGINLPGYRLLRESEYKKGSADIRVVGGVPQKELLSLSGKKNDDELYNEALRTLLFQERLSSDVIRMITDSILRKDSSEKEKEPARKAGYYWVERVFHEKETPRYKSNGHTYALPGVYKGAKGMLLYKNKVLQALVFPAIHDREVTVIIPQMQDDILLGYRIYEGNQVRDTNRKYVWKNGRLVGAYTVIDRAHLEVASELYISNLRVNEDGRVACGETVCVPPDFRNRPCAAYVVQGKIKTLIFPPMGALPYVTIEVEREGDFISRLIISGWDQPFDYCLAWQNETVVASFVSISHEQLRALGNVRITEVPVSKDREISIGGNPLNRIRLPREYAGRQCTLFVSGGFIDKILLSEDDFIEVKRKKDGMIVELRIIKDGVPARNIMYKRVYVDGKLVLTFRSLTDAVKKELSQYKRVVITHVRTGEGEFVMGERFGLPHEFSNRMCSVMYARQHVRKLRFRSEEGLKSAGVKIGWNTDDDSVVSFSVTYGDGQKKSISYKLVANAMDQGKSSYYLRQPKSAYEKAWVYSMRAKSGGRVSYNGCDVFLGKEYKGCKCHIKVENNRIRQIHIDADDEESDVRIFVEYAGDLVESLLFVQGDETWKKEYNKLVVEGTAIKTYLAMSDTLKSQIAELGTVSIEGAKAQHYLRALPDNPPCPPQFVGKRYKAEVENGVTKEIIFYKDWQARHPMAQMHIKRSEERKDLIESYMVTEKHRTRTTMFKKVYVDDELHGTYLSLPAWLQEISYAKITELTLDDDGTIDIVGKTIRLGYAFRRRPIEAVVVDGLPVAVHVLGNEFDEPSYVQVRYKERTITGIDFYDKNHTYVTSKEYYLVRDRDGRLSSFAPDQSMRRIGNHLRTMKFNGYVKEVPVYTDGALVFGNDTYLFPDLAGQEVLVNCKEGVPISVISINEKTGMLSARDINAKHDSVAESWTDEKKNMFQSLAPIVRRMSYDLARYASIFGVTREDLQEEGESSVRKALYAYHGNTMTPQYKKYLKLTCKFAMMESIATAACSRYGISRRDYKRCGELQEARISFYQKTGHSPNRDELSKVMRLSQDEVGDLLSMREAIFSGYSFEAERDNDRALHEKIAGDASYEPGKKVEKRESAQILKTIFTVLDDDEKELLEIYFKNDRLSMKERAYIYGLDEAEFKERAESILVRLKHMLGVSKIGTDALADSIVHQNGTGHLNNENGFSVTEAVILLVAICVGIAFSLLLQNETIRTICFTFQSAIMGISLSFIVGSIALLMLDYVKKMCTNDSEEQIIEVFKEMTFTVWAFFVCYHIVTGVLFHPLVQNYIDMHRWSVGIWSGVILFATSVAWGRMYEKGQIFPKYELKQRKRKIVNAGKVNLVPEAQENMTNVSQEELVIGLTDVAMTKRVGAFKASPLFDVFVGLLSKEQNNKVLPIVTMLLQRLIPGDRDEQYIRAIIAEVTAQQTNTVYESVSLGRAGTVLVMDSHVIDALEAVSSRDKKVLEGLRNSGLLSYDALIVGLNPADLVKSNLTVEQYQEKAAQLLMEYVGVKTPAIFWYRLESNSSVNDQTNDLLTHARTFKEVVVFDTKRSPYFTTRIARSLDTTAHLVGIELSTKESITAFFVEDCAQWLVRCAAETRDKLIRAAA